MKKITSYIIGILLLIGLVSCKPKKCGNFADPRNNYHAKYDKKGLVKSKNKSRSARSSWNNRY